MVMSLEFSNFGGFLGTESDWKMVKSPFKIEIDGYWREFLLKRSNLLDGIGSFNFSNQF